jgi:hypothetical protein
MDSFNAYAQRARDYASKAKDIVSNPDAQKMFLVTVAIPAALFVLLSPGLILNIPNNSKGFCLKQVPLPATATGVCTDGAFVPGTGDVAAGFTAAAILPICKKQRECGYFGASGYTGYGSIVVHAFVFVLLSYLVMSGLRRGGIYA